MCRATLGASYSPNVDTVEKMEMRNFSIYRTAKKLRLWDVRPCKTLCDLGGLSIQIYKEKAYIMITGRDLSNLGKDGDAVLALEAIISYFGENYLDLNKKHRLSQLWSRADRLATVELYTLGKCLEKFTPENEKWLKATISSIRKLSPDIHHGFFTEIIYFGMFGLHKSKIEPAKGKNPGYDFSTELPNGTKQLISVKNIDISDSQKKFQENCRRLRAKWREKLKFYNAKLSIRVVSSKTLELDDFELLIKEIKSLSSLPTRRTHQLNEYIKIYIHELPPSEYNLSPPHISDMVLVFCPSPESEKTRYIRKIREAVDNIAKHTTVSENTSLVIFMRMHVSADYSYIVKQAKSFVNDSENKVDCIICYQPSYVKNKDDNSLLHHCFKFEASARYVMQMAGSDCYQVEIPIGSVSTEQSLVKIVDLETGLETYISPSDYLFQQGDIYLLAKQGSDGSLYYENLGSFPGIKKHGVFYMNGDYMTTESKTTPKVEDLLIV